MKAIKIKPIEITGACRAGLTLADEFEIRGMNLVNPKHSRLCFLALSHLPPTVTQLQRGNCAVAHLCCPECLSGPENENRVVFLLETA